MPDRDLETHRALTRKPGLHEDNFRRRPNEESLSVATNEVKAKNTLKCFGCAVLTVGRIEDIVNFRLTVQVKPPEGQDGLTDPELLEILGVPQHADEVLALNCARDLIKSVVRHHSQNRATRAEAA